MPSQLSQAALAFHVTENAWVHASHADKKPIRLVDRPKAAATKAQAKAN
jgi:hypothetical protein